MQDPLEEDGDDADGKAKESEAEGGEEELSEATESDCEVSSSEDELKVTASAKVQKMHDEESHDDGAEETKEPARPIMVKSVREIANPKKPAKGEVEVDF